MLIYFRSAQNSSHVEGSFLSFKKFNEVESFNDKIKEVEDSRDEMPKSFPVFFTKNLSGLYGDSKLLHVPIPLPVELCLETESFCSVLSDVQVPSTILCM